MVLSQWLKSRTPSGDPEEFRLSLVEHLDELRTRIIRSIYMLLIGWVVGWFAFEKINPMLERHLQSLIKPTGVSYKEAFLDFTGPFFLQLKLSFVVGLFIVGPLVIIQLWGFVKPGLKPSERKPFAVIGPFSVFLFALGCYFCWLILPTTISWFVGFGAAAFPGTEIIQEKGKLTSFVFNMMLAFGLCFQLPLVVYFLAMIGLLPPESLNKYWRHATVVIFIVSAVVTPSQDPISMLTMAVPLCILFVISVLAVRITHRRRALAGAPEELPD